MFDINKQLRVIYPYGGVHFMLKWFTHNRGSHIILAKSKSALEQTAKSVLSKISNVDEAKCQSYHKIDIVFPTDNFVKEAFLKILEQEARDFAYTYGSLVHSYVDNGLALPSTLKKCHCVPSDDYDHSHDYDCIFCYGTGISIKNGTWVEHYLPIRAQYITDINNRTKRSSQWKISQAPIVQSDDGVFAVAPEFGDHQSGIFINQLNDHIDDVLFFFKEIQEEDASFFNEHISSLVKKNSESKSGHKRMMEIIANDHRKKNLDEIQKYFGV